MQHRWSEKDRQQKRKKRTPRGRWGGARERGNDGLEASHSYTAGESLKAQ